MKVLSVFALSLLKVVFFLAAGDRFSENSSCHFPELSIAFDNISIKSPEVLLHLERIREAQAHYSIAKSASGLKSGINLQGQSVYEDRPSQNYYQHYRVISSAYLRKPLYHWGALKAQKEIGELNVKYSKRSLSMLRKSIKLIVESDYLNLVLLNYQKNLASETLEIARENEDEQIKKKDLGLVTDLSVNESKASRIQQEIKLFDLENSLSLKKKLFDQSIGEDSNFSFGISEEFKRFCRNHNFDSVMPIVISQFSSYDLDRLENEIEIGKRQIRIADSKLKPKLNLFGGFFQDQVSLPYNRENINRNNFVIGIEVDWAVWDSSQSRGEKMVALSKLKQRELEIQLASEKERIEFENLRQQLFSSTKSIVAQRKLVEVAEEGYEISKVKFSQNRIRSNEHLQSRIILDSTRMSLMEKIFNFLKSRSIYLSRIEP